MIQLFLKTKSVYMPVFFSPLWIFQSGSWSKNIFLRKDNNSCLSQLKLTVEPSCNFARTSKAFLVQLADKFRKFWRSLYKFGQIFAKFQLFFEIMVCRSWWCRRCADHSFSGKLSLHLSCVCPKYYHDRTNNYGDMSWCV